MMSFGVRLLMAFVLMAILITVIVSFIEPVILRWFLIVLSIVLVLTFSNSSIFTKQNQ